jgi:hypothetical protein
MAAVVVKTVAVVTTTAVTAMTDALHLRTKVAAVAAALSQAHRGGGYLVVVNSSF